MFKTIQQSERAYTALKEFYKQKITDTMQRHGVVNLANRLRVTRDQIYKTLNRGSFSALRRLAIKINEGEL